MSASESHLHLRDVTPSNAGIIERAVVALPDVVRAVVDAQARVLKLGHHGRPETLLPLVHAAVQDAGARCLVSRTLWKPPIDLSNLEGVGDLDIDCFSGIEEIPDGLWRLPIERFTLRNFGGLLPKGIAQLEQLDCLILDKWQGERFDEAFACPHLQRLEVHGRFDLKIAKKRVAVPVGPPASLAQLRSLALCRLPFTDVPSWLAQASQLRRLWMGCCGLKKVPAWLTALPQLEELDLCDNPLRTLPELTAPIKRLRLTDTKLATWPAGLEHLELSELLVKGTDLEQAPDWLGSFRGICELPEKLAEDVRRVQRGEPLPEAISAPCAEEASTGPQWVQQLGQLAGELRRALPDERCLAVYLLEPGGPHGWIGGPAPGIRGAEYPRGRNGEAMTHLFTLDFGQIPELAYRHPGYAAASVFLLRPDSNAAHSPDSGHSAVILTPDAKLGSTTDGVAGAGLGYRLFRLLVPPTAFAAKVSKALAQPHGALKAALSRAHARVLGPPLWIQQPQAEGEVLVQCNDSFVEANFGDSGSLYVFADDAFWQCY